MNPVVIKVAKKIGTLVVTVGLPAACSFFENRALEAKMKKIAEEVVKNSGKN